MSKSGMDVLLSQQGKSLAPGEQLRLVLVKGKSGITCQDPVHSKAPPESFPLLAKFPESVVKPDFTTPQWGKARLYQQDTPKAQDDSDDEDAEKQQQQKKKRWRRRKQPPKRQWILQPETEFLETMMAKRQKKAPVKNQSAYEGFPEHNPSHYAILSASTSKVEVDMLPTPHAAQAFAQPRKALSLTQAEQAISDQRAHMSRYMMHSKGRLLGKLQEAADDEEDVMADVAFKNRKSGGGRAREELLTSMADEGVAVDDDGVLGGTNDAEFGGRRHFGRLKKEDTKRDTEEAGGERGAVGNDGLAMSDDFYKRDVMLEYEELDYDANEQFEDDDVDMGESEMHVDPNSGFGEEDDNPEDEEYDSDTVGGAEGLATVAGFRALLAKARGETPPEQEANAAESKEDKKDGSRPSSPKTADAATAEDGASKVAGTDTLASVMAAAEKTAQAAKDKTAAKDKKPAPTGVELDENGQRLLTLEAIRREIWLHHGAIRMKRLMKIFDIKKKSSLERKNKFQELVKELCTMKIDPVEGNMLVLKQHYASMG